MLITRTSALSGIIRTIDMPVNEEDMKRYENGALVQDAFPYLSPGQREFIMTGATPEEWNEVFEDEDDIMEDDE